MICETHWAKQGVPGVKHPHFAGLIDLLGVEIKPRFIEQNPLDGAEYLAALGRTYTSSRKMGTGGVRLGS